MENLGWQCVTKKGEFKVGDIFCYFEIDSILPDKDWSKFMEPKKFRVKSIRLKKELSQGLALPLSILNDVMEPKKIAKLKVGDEVTQILGVTKYEIQDRHSRGSNKTWAPTAAAFPRFIPKTDEIRLQSALGVLEEIKGRPFYITLKYDGTSATYAKHEGKFWACSRNRAVKRNVVELFYNQIFAKLCRNKLTRLLLPLWTLVFRFWEKFLPLPQQKNEEENPWWAMADKYNLKKILPEGFAIQGEICGPAIQGNKLELKEKDLFVFNVFDIVNQRYLNYQEFIEFCEKYGLKDVKVLKIVDDNSFELSLNNLLEFAKGKYPNTKNHREGIVLRPLEEAYSECLKGRLSFKVINNEFLLKYDDE